MNRAELFEAIRELDPLPDSAVVDRDALLTIVDSKAGSSGLGRRWVYPRLRGPARAVIVFLIVIAIGAPLYLLRLAPLEEPPANTYSAPGVTGYVPIGVGAGVRTIGVGEDGVVWIMSANERTLYRVDRERMEVVETYPIDAYVEGNPVGGGSVWLMSYDPPGVLRFDPSAGLFKRGAVTGTIPLVDPAAGATWAFDSLWLSTQEGRLLRFDSTAAQTGDFAVDVAGPGPRFLTSGFGSIWMGSSNGRVYRIDPDSGSVLASVEIPGEPRAITTGNDHVWVSDVARSSVIKIDPSTNEIVGETAVARFPHSLAATQGSVWVSDFMDYTISEIDARSGALLRTVPLPGRPGMGVVLDGRLLVSLHRAPGLAEIDPGAEMLTMPADGRLDVVVPVGERAVRLLCTGAGSPTILLEADQGEGAGSWSVVQAKLSQSFRVCSSDRSGAYAVDDFPRDGSGAASDLYAALEQVGEVGPYVAVGHGAGAFVVRALAEQQPEAVLGMVLVDPVPDRFLEDAAAILPESMLRTFAQHLAGGDEASELQRTVRGGDFGALPLIVIAADTERMFGPDGDLDQVSSQRLREAWRSGQEEISALSTEGALIEADGSDHFIQYWQPDRVVGAVHAVLP
jgi:streptogramin lyase/pimeloyl-ACP methyl ester carboxylesterase